LRIYLHQVNLSIHLKQIKTDTEPIYALAFGAHPDDVELACAATMLKLHREKKSVAICDLTEGEKGTRGTRAIRQREAKEAANLLGVAERMNLNLGDTTFENNIENREKLISVIRYFKPVVVFATQPEERHPDHIRASQMITEACFYAGLRKIQTQWKGKAQEAHRPKYLLYYIQDRFTEPDFILDVSDTYEDSRNAILAYKSQFYNPDSTEPETFISRKEFLEGLDAKARVFGEMIGVKYGEGFLVHRHLGIATFSDVFR
jgi:bacillithiol biosynthesis deacetylase BshB1